MPSWAAPGTLIRAEGQVVGWVVHAAVVSGETAAGWAVFGETVFEETVFEETGTRGAGRCEKEM